MARKEKHDYFAAFTKQAELALEEANLLVKGIEEFTTAEAVQELMSEAHEIESAADEVNHQNFQSIAIDFITPIDRDDVLSISQSLDEVIDEIEDVIQEFYIMDVHFMHRDAHEMASIIQNSCEALLTATKELPNFKKSPTFKQAIIDVNNFEEAADKLYARIIRDLHTNDADNAMRVLVWSRIFSKMERCTDAAEHVADIMNSVILKNS